MIEIPGILWLVERFQAWREGRKPSDEIVNDALKSLGSETRDLTPAESAYIEHMVEMKMRLQIIPRMEENMQEWDKILGERMPRPWESKMRAPIHCPAGADWRES